jgi:hypothetical protein
MSNMDYPRLLCYYVADLEISMPLQATHIKFAMDFKENHSVFSVDEYLSGAVYPDSRTVTGVERKLTHNIEELKKLSSESDFHLGWYAHCLCDEKFLESSELFFSKYLAGFESKEYGSPWWVSLTALKVLFESQILKSFNVKEFLPLINRHKNPNNEPLEEIVKYYDSIKNTYDGDVSLEKIIEDLTVFGVPHKLKCDIEKKLDEFANDIDPDEFEKVYLEMIK